MYDVPLEPAHTASLSRQPVCPACPHEHHLLDCDVCECSAPPIPGVYT